MPKKLIDYTLAAIIILAGLAFDWSLMDWVRANTSALLFYIFTYALVLIALYLITR